MRYMELTGESAEYREQREALRIAELELMRQRERVAEMRRGLPQGPVVEDYVFLEGPEDLDAGDTPVRSVRLSELFTAPGRSLVVYHLMLGKRQTSPCPMCTMWIDGYNAVARHVGQNADLVIAAAADPATLRAHARDRGWRDLRLLSCGDGTFKRDLGSEDADGKQDSTISVFTRGAALLHGAPADGRRRHGAGPRPALAGVEHPRPHPPGAGGLVRPAELRLDSRS